jgi:hypothetical protein
MESKHVEDREGDGSGRVTLKFIFREVGCEDVN